MLRVTQAELSRYRREVDAQSDKAREYFRAAIAEFYRRYPDATTEDTRVFVLDLMGSALPNFTDLTATLACDLFDELAEEVGFEGERARLYETTDWQMVDRKVHYLAEFLNEGDKERFKREVSDLTHYYCKRAAYDNMVANCRGQRVKWARVPTGLETCAFCFMLASRGFAYLSEKSAAEGHHGYHNNCDCVVVPGFEGPDGNPRVKVDGYDPEVMYQNWLSCAKTVGINKHADPMSGEWTDDERRAVRREVATRDWHWLYTGEEPKLEHYRLSNKQYKKLKREKPKEAAGYQRLSELGFDVDILLEDRSASANIDAIIRTMHGDGYWELKTPRKGMDALKSLLSDGYSKWQRMRSGKVQSGVDIRAIGHPRMIVDNRYSEMSDDDAIQTVLSDMEYLTSKGGEPFDEALVILKDGSLRRLFRSAV